MSRNITVTLANGVKHVYANAPDNVTPQQVQERAQREFGQSVVHLDGGRNASAPTVVKAPPKPGSSEAFQQRWANMKPEHAAGIIQRFSAQAAAQGPAALKAFNARPDTQALKAIAGGAQPSLPTPAPAQTQDQRIAAGAKSASDAEGGSDFLNAAGAGLRRGMFGLPERLAAAGERFLPSSWTGNTTNASYDNILQALRAKTDAEMGKSTAGAVTGQIAGNVAAGLGAGGLLKSAGTKLAASTAEGIGGVIDRGAGNVLSGLTTQAVPTVGKGLSMASKAANAARLVAAGAAGGGAQAAGEGGDVVQGAEAGAATAGAVGGAGKLLSVAAQPIKAVLGLSTAGQILSKFTSVTADTIRARAAQYRSVTGAEPTLFELLPPQDRNALLKGVVAGKDPIVDQATRAIQARANNLGPEMSRRVEQIVAPQRAAVRDGIVTDMERAHGVAAGDLTPAHHAEIDAAMNSPTDMEALRHTEVNAINAPHANTPVGNNLHDLYPQTPAGMTESGDIVPPQNLDPEASNMIRNMSGNMQARPTDAGVTAGDVTGIMQNLRRVLGGNDPMQAAVAQRAIDHLQGHLEEVAPAAGEASTAATNAYAARSRMIEGMKEGAATRLRNTVQVGTNGNTARTVRNAYDTAEGTAGRTLGQSNAITNDLGGSPAEALKATIGMSRNSTGREITQNLGQDASAPITAAAQAQDESAQALSSASSKVNASGGQSDVNTLVNGLIGLHPGGFVATKAHAIMKLAKMTVVPENQARTIVDMLFSQDPAMTRRAAEALSNIPGGQNALQSIAATAGIGGGGTVAAPAQVSTDAPDTPDDIGPIPGQPTQAPAPEAPDAPAQGDPNTPSASPYAGLLNSALDGENPEAVKFTDGIAQAETNGQHFNPDGTPKVSSAGAVGLMQLMPKYGADFAREAGVPYDPTALHEDPTYNRLLGHAHAMKLLRHYDGDPAKAAAAYNAGQGAVDHAAANHDDWLAALPEETQNYVPKVLS